MSYVLFVVSFMGALISLLMVGWCVQGFVLFLFVVGFCYGGFKGLCVLFVLFWGL